MKGLLLLSAVAAASGAATLDAQGTRARPDSGCTKYSDGQVECRVRIRVPGDSGFGNRVFFRMDSAMAKRAALGIEMRSTGTRRDTLGVFVEAVRPKGPAESAGIIEGDRIAAINGVDLRTPAADVDDEYSNGLAAHRLTREMEKVAPGSRVILRIYSGGRFRDVQVVAGKASDVLLHSMTMPSPDMQRLRERLEPLIRDHIEQLQYRPDGVRFRSPTRIRTLTPARVRRVVSEDGFGEGELQPVTAAAIRELAANAIRDAKSALVKLAADGVV